MRSEPDLRGGRVAIFAKSEGVRSAHDRSSLMQDPNRRTVVGSLVALGFTGAPRGLSEMPLMNTPVHSPGLAETLLAPAPHPSLGKHADTFGRIIGSWVGEYRDRHPGQPDEAADQRSPVSATKLSGQIHHADKVGRWNDRCVRNLLRSLVRVLLPAL